MPIRLPPITRNLIVANVALFLLQQVIGDYLLVHFALWPLGADQMLRAADGSVVSVGFRFWQLLTYGFLHGGYLHIFSNMFGLFMFGRIVEPVLGKRNFTIYYFVCLITAGLTQLVVARFAHDVYPTLGASGGVFGVLLAFGMLYPREKIIVFPIPIPISAWVLVPGYALVELFFGVTNTLPGIAHYAHLGGMLGGFLMIEYWRGKLPIKPNRRLMR
ncbi:rhomboid family intramembrane serine protease [Dyella mobilis]|uniref:Rhomboid family intramembrane serine protease n=2 Tax=Dyella mobilis TaxID=1849582 RepID=A0ABS2KLM4_9GAMM|nr:rhomboid family intramembrane serine protease [Dyella mobilis]MBM7132047.1 rhomboid family intramembrane serine protease [Dyella mobilis]GLQ95967.1 rhomboid family intramembrane serine protease [Dyella mobilis]